VNLWLQVVLTGLAAGSVYGLLAIGHTLVYRLTGIVYSALGDLVGLRPRCKDAGSPIVGELSRRLRTPQIGRTAGPGDTVNVSPSPPTRNRS
jgi:hypothetical protein